MKINEDTLKLKTNLNLTNMVLFTENNNIKKFDSIYSIFSSYYEKRLDLYQKRKEYQIQYLEEQLELSLIHI